MRTILPVQARTSCLSCSKPLDRKGRNRTGLCRVCAAKARGGIPNPNVSAAMKRWAAENRDAVRATLDRNRAQRNAGMLRALGRNQAATVLNRADVRERNKAAVAAAATERFLGWCPPSYRDMAKDLRTKLGTAAEARRVVLAQIDADIRAHLSGALLDQASFIAVRDAMRWMGERQAA